MGLDPLSPIHMRPPEPDPLPLHVDVINGWSLTAQGMNMREAGTGEFGEILFRLHRRQMPDGGGTLRLVICPSPSISNCSTILNRVKFRSTNRRNNFAGSI